VIALADAVGSTTQIIDAARRLSNPQFIVATDQGIFYQLQQQVPDKEFIIAPPPARALPAAAARIARGWR